MAELTITRSIRPIPRRPAPPVPRRIVRRFVIADAAGHRLELPFVPLPTSHGGFGWRWEVVERAGRTPLLLRGTRNIKELSFTLLLGHSDYQHTIDLTLNALENLAGLGGPFSLTYARPERGLWRLTALSYEVTLRAPVTNAPTRAMVSLAFTETSDRPRLVGPARKAPTTSKKTPTTPKKPAQRTYTVRSGDTLSGIAQRLYGAAYKWRQIADLNGIRDPRTLRVGQVLRLP